MNTTSAPAIPGTLRLDKEAQRLGVDVFSITGRYEAERAANEGDLHAQGYVWKQLMLRPESTRSETTIQYKSGARAQIAVWAIRSCSTSATSGAIGRELRRPSSASSIRTRVI